MSKLSFVLLAIALLAFVGGSAQNNGPGEPAGDCPPPFHLHNAPEHDDHHDDHAHGEHRHVGSETDLNADGWICVMHATPDDTIHVHIDNDVRIR